MVSLMECSFVLHVSHTRLPLLRVISAYVPVVVFVGDKHRFISRSFGWTVFSSVLNLAGYAFQSAIVD